MMASTVYEREISVVLCHASNPPCVQNTQSRYLGMIQHLWPLLFLSVNFFYFLFYILLYRYTSKGKEVFAITLSWPRSGKLVLGDPTVTDQTRVTMLGTKRRITWIHGSKHKGGKSGVVIHAPVIPVSDLPCLWAWVFKLSHVKWFYWTVNPVTAKSSKGQNSRKIPNSTL